jgi:hypothetical protein
MSDAIGLIAGLIPCRCGSLPERDVSRRGYRYSVSCKCGGDVINFVARSDNEQKLADNWSSLITRQPFKHYVYHLPEPDTDVPSFHGYDYHDSCPLRRQVRSMGGHCSG